MEDKDGRRIHKYCTYCSHYVPVKTEKGGLAYACENGYADAKPFSGCSGWENGLTHEYYWNGTKIDDKIVDNVNHPQHYKGKHGMEVIDIIDEFVDDPNSYCKGNVIKYVLRSQKKGGVEDLKKARWYLNKMIEEMEALDERAADKRERNVL